MMLMVVYSRYVRQHLATQVHPRVSCQSVSVSRWQGRSQFPWPSADARSDAAPLAAPWSLRLDAAHPHVRQQVHQLQSCGW